MTERDGDTPPNPVAPPAPPSSRSLGANPFAQRGREPWINPAKRRSAVLLAVLAVVLVLAIGILVGIVAGRGHHHHDRDLQFDGGWPRLFQNGVGYQPPPLDEYSGPAAPSSLGQPQPSGSSHS